jgi:hypothetical protein
MWLKCFSGYPIWLLFLFVCFLRPRSFVSSFFAQLELAGKSYQTRRYPDHTWHVVVGQHRDRHVVLCLLQETHVWPPIPQRSSRRPFLMEKSELSYRQLDLPMQIRSHEENVLLKFIPYPVGWKIKAASGDTWREPGRFKDGAAADQHEIQRRIWH